MSRTKKKSCWRFVLMPILEIEWYIACWSDNCCKLHLHLLQFCFKNKFSHHLCSKDTDFRVQYHKINSEYFTYKIFRPLNFRVKYSLNRRPLTTLNAYIIYTALETFVCLLFGQFCLSEFFKLSMISKNTWKRINLSSNSAKRFPDNKRKAVLNY